MHTRAIQAGWTTTMSTFTATTTTTRERESTDPMMTMSHS